MKFLKKYWVALAIAVILIVFFVIAGYNNFILPDKEVDRKIGYRPEDYITLGKYKGLSYEQSRPGVSDRELQEAIDEELIDYKKVDREAKSGDSVSIDYAAYVDGTKDKNLSEKKFDITIGEEDICKEFDEAVTGKKKGDEVKVTLDDVSGFPMDESKDYTGKKVDFTITVNSVSEEYTVELTDDWVEENYGDDYDCHTVDEYKKMTKESLMEDSKATIEEQTETDLWQKVVDGSRMNGYPQELYDEIVEIDDADTAYQADQWGMSVDEYYDFIGVDKDKIDETYLADVKSDLVMWAIAKAENITETKEQIEQGYEDMYEEFGYDSPDEMKAEHTDDEIEHALIEYDVIQFVVDHAKIKEVPSVESTEESVE